MEGANIEHKIRSAGICILRSCRSTSSSSPPCHWVDVTHSSGIAVMPSKTLLCAIGDLLIVGREEVVAKSWPRHRSYRARSATRTLSVSWEMYWLGRFGRVMVVGTMDGEKDR
jgi:hypothetical protein